MKLSSCDLENISLGQFSQLENWESNDMDPNRLIIPSSPYLFMTEVQKIHDSRIHYTCDPKTNALLKNYTMLPPGIVMEFFQGYMVLADWLGYAQLPTNTVKRLHRAGGGEFAYRNILPSIDRTLTVDIEITKITKFGKTTVLQYKGGLYDQDTLLIEVINFNGIFYDPGPESAPQKKLPFFQKPEGNPVSLLNEQQQTQGLALPYRSVERYDNVLIARYDISPDDWFFKCHFIHDPCMPGSLILQGAFDILSIYTQTQNQPLCNETISTAAKMHVLPTNKELTLQLTIKEENNEFIKADYHVFVDQQLSFECKNIGIQK